MICDFLFMYLDLWTVVSGNKYVTESDFSYEGTYRSEFGKEHRIADRVCTVQK